MGIMPSEFWAMTPHEFLALVEMEADNSPVSSKGKMSRALARELESEIDLSDEEWWAKHGASRD